MPKYFPVLIKDLKEFIKDLPDNMEVHTNNNQYMGGYCGVYEMQIILDEAGQPFLALD